MRFAAFIAGLAAAYTAGRLVARYIDARRGPAWETAAWYIEDGLAQAEDYLALAAATDEEAGQE